MNSCQGELQNHPIQLQQTQWTTGKDLFNIEMTDCITTISLNAPGNNVTIILQRRK